MSLISSLILHSFLSEPTEGTEHHAEKSFNLMHHILDHSVIELPTVFGINLSITHHAEMMFIAALVLLVFLVGVLRKDSLVPRGVFSNMIESVVDFLRKDIIYNYIGKEGKHFETYILTVFFFILVNNLMGLVPGGAAATSDIAVTATLAITTFLIVLITGMKRNGILGYWKGLVPPGLPVFIVPLVFFLEVLGMCIKHFVLCMRLFANMTAGHIAILALISLIFVFKSYFIAPLPVIGALAISGLEIIVAFVQAYVFTLLSAVFIGMSVHQEH